MPDRKNFVPPAMEERNRQFIQLNGFKPGIQISSEGSRWPDFLANGGGYISFFVSEKVISDIREAGIEVLDVTEFPIESIENPRRSKLRLEEAPRYFVLEAHPELVPDWATMGIPTDGEGRPMLTPLPKGYPPTPFIYRKEPWSGRDLVSEEQISTRLFCSERFKALAEAKRWTNLRLERMGWHTIRKPGAEDAAMQS